MESAARILKAEVAPVKVAAGMHVFPSAQAAKIGKKVPTLKQSLHLDGSHSFHFPSRMIN